LSERFCDFRSRKNSCSEFFHNALSAALSNGAALTPDEWNDFFDWGVVTPEMKTHLRYFNRFVAGLPLAQWNPQPIKITEESDTTNAWGIMSNKGGIIWVQDKLTEDLAITEVREQRSTRTNLHLSFTLTNANNYSVTPFNPWSGEFGESFTVNCTSINNNTCNIELPDFLSDIALRFESIGE